MRKKLLLLSIFCLFITNAQAGDWLSRFDFTPKVSARFKAKSLPIPEQQYFEESSVDDYNSAVGLNNQAIDAMNNDRYDEAVELLGNAVEQSPATIGFRKNYLLALNNAKINEELVRQALIILSIDSNDHKTAYIAGLSYLNDLNEYEEAANYFNYALNLDKDNLSYASALINALEKTGKYNDTVFELLKKYAPKSNEPYLYYLLGLKYLDKKNYTKSIENLKLAKKYDKNGYTYHAYSNAVFYSGNMEGLESIAKSAIQKFPNDQNIGNTKRIYNSLKNREYKLKEKIKVNLTNASSLDELYFNVRPISNFSEHQKVNIISAKLFSKGKTAEVKPLKESDGSLKIEVPKNMWGREIILELSYTVKVKALFCFYNNDTTVPDVKKLKKDSKLSLSDKRIEELANYIDSLFLEDAEQYTAYEELFAAKASTAIANGLRYQENGIDQSVSWALDNLNKCDCTEYSRLLVALCLNRGIPARLVSGFLIKSEFLGKDTPIGHEWCEIYVNNRGWTPIDPTLQTTMHRAYFKNILNDQIFFEYPNKYDTSRIGVQYTGRSSSNDTGVEVSIESFYNISNL